jgi:hypothetical protein
MRAERLANAIRRDPDVLDDAIARAAQDEHRELVTT